MASWGLQALLTLGRVILIHPVYSIPHRDLEDRFLAGDQAAALAIEMFCYRVAKYVAAYTVPLGR